MNLKKIAKVTIISLGSLLVLLMLLPFAFKGKIVAAVQKAANENVNAKVNFSDDVSLSLIRNFPNLSIGISDLQIVGVDSFANDTLIKAKNVRFVLDLASVMGGNAINIRKIGLSDARLNVIFLKSGATNIDIAKGSDSKQGGDSAEASKPLNIKINELKIENTRIHYIDHSLNFELTTNGTQLLSSGDFTDDLFTLKNEINIDKTSMVFGGMTLLSDAKLVGNTAIDMDMKKMRFGFADNHFQINDLPLKAKGWIEMREKDMAMDINVSTPNSDFKSFLSVVPGCYTSNFADVKASGTLSLLFTMKGIMDDLRMPSTHAEIKIGNASFQYPDLPAKASNIQLNFTLDNTDGNPDNTYMVVAPFAANLGGDNLSVTLEARTPLSNPYAKGEIKADVHLDRWKNLLPFEKGTSLAGEIKVDFNFDGHYSADIKKGLADLKAGGNIAMSKINYEGPGMLPVKIQDLRMQVSPVDFKIQAIGLQYGSSSFALNGKLQNMLGYYLNGETLTGQLVMNSQKVDLNEWMKSSTANAGATPMPSTFSAPRIPDKINFMISANVGQLLFEQFNLQQSTAKIEIKNAALSVNPLSTLMFGSKVEVADLYYTYPISGKPQFTTNFNILNANPSSIATNLSVIKAYAPILSKIQGLANLQTKMSAVFLPDFTMDLGSLKAGGVFDLFSGTLEIPAWMVAATQKLQWGVKSLSLKPSKAAFMIEDGKFQLKDTLNIALPKDFMMHLAGHIGLDKQLHLGGYLSTKGKRLPFKITGDINAPKMAIAWRGSAKQMALPLLSKAKSELVDATTKKIDEMLKKASEQAEAMRKNAKEKAEQIREMGREAASKQRAETERIFNLAMAEAQKEVDALVAAANDPIKKKLARAAADKIIKTAEKKANVGRVEGYKIADKIESEATSKADYLESQSNEQANKIEEAARNEAEKISSNAVKRTNANKSTNALDKQ